MKTDTIREVDVWGSRVRVCVREGTGTPLLMCNGIGASIELLQPFVDALDPTIPVIRFDIPGTGGSELPALPYNYASMSLRLAEVLDELGYDEVDVLGISWGGGLAQQFAFQNPDRCRRLVLVSTSAGFLMVPGGPQVLSNMMTPRRYHDADYAARIAPTIYGGKMREDPGLVSRVLAAHAPLVSMSGYLMQLLASAGWTSLPFLGMIRQPTLIMAGDDDPIIPLINAKVMARMLPDARLEIFEDGHLGLITGAQELAPIIADFLQEEREVA